MAKLAKARDCNEKTQSNLEIGCSTHPLEIFFIPTFLIFFSLIDPEKHVQI